MICEQCQVQQANVFITEIINGKKVQKHLCHGCAKEKQEKLYNDDSFQQFLTGLLKLQGNDIKELNNSSKVCPKCKCTLDEFRKTSKIGCDECYSVFKPYISQIVKRVQGAKLHTGKKPQRLNEKVRISEQILDFEKQLKLALMQEDYHEAARLRDILLKLKEENA